MVKNLKMSLKVLNKKKNELFAREEIVAQMTVESATPSRKQVIDELSKSLGVSSDKIVVDEIIQKFGTKQVEIHARVYDSNDLLKKHELDYKTKRVKEPGAKPASQ